MDLKAQRHWRVKVAGTAQPLQFRASIREAFPRVIQHLMSQRNGDFTIECSREPIAPDQFAAPLAGLESPATTPEPVEGESYESYYSRWLVHFEGAESMARFIANDHFGNPQLPWLGLIPSDMFWYSS